MMVDPTASPEKGFYLAEPHVIFLPLLTWFSRGPAGQALPLISLQFHEVSLHFRLASAEQIAVELPTTPGAGYDPTGNPQAIPPIAGDNLDLDTRVPFPKQSGLKAFTYTPNGPQQSDGFFNNGVTENTDWYKKFSFTPVSTPNVGEFEFRFFADYVFLDTAERRRFATTEQTYLIEQLQTTGPISVEAGAMHSIPFTFNHPTKALWYAWRADANAMGTRTRVAWDGSTDMDAIDATTSGGSKPTAAYLPENRRATLVMTPFCNANASFETNERYGGEHLLQRFNPVRSASLRLNGHERWGRRPGAYFTTVQPHAHATTASPTNFAGMYAFCLDVTALQPTGTINLSRIDSSTLHLEMQPRRTAARTRRAACNSGASRTTSSSCARGWVD